VSSRHLHEASPSRFGANQSGPALAFLRDVHVGLVERLQRAPAGPQAVWGPDREHSPDPAARALRNVAGGFEWVAVTFPGWSLWHLHLGLVSRTPGVFTLGLHWHEAVRDQLPHSVDDFAACAIVTDYYEQSGEHHADLLVVAVTACPRQRAVQILTDAALDLAQLLSAPLAVGPTPHPLQEFSHDL